MLSRDVNETLQNLRPSYGLFNVGGAYLHTKESIELCGKLALKDGEST